MPVGANSIKRAAKAVNKNVETVEAAREEEKNTEAAQSVGKAMKTAGTETADSPAAASSKSRASKAKATEKKASEAKASGTKVPEKKVPETKTSETSETSETKTSETEISETKAPETKTSAMKTTKGRAGKKTVSDPAAKTLEKPEDFKSHYGILDELPVHLL